MACNCANEEISKKILEMMKESGAHLQGHFKLTSGLHSDNYMQCALMLRFPQYAAYAGAELAKLLAPYKPEFILSPALGGLIIGHEVARSLPAPRRETLRARRRRLHDGKILARVGADTRRRRRGMGRFRLHCRPPRLGVPA